MPYLQPLVEAQTQVIQPSIETAQQPIYRQPVEAPHQRVVHIAAKLPTKKKSSKWLYLGTTIIAFILWFIVVLSQYSTTVTLIITLIIYLYAYIMFVILLYQAWRIFPHIWPRAMPSQAAIFLFIPIFNFVWAFHVIYGFAKDYNAYVVENGNVKDKVTDSVFLIFCALNLIIFILRWFHFSFVEFLPIVLWVLLLIMINQMCNAINAINTMTYSGEEQIQLETGQ
jgi:hypothetical protein